MADAAVIFDVDGVLLELTRPEEDAFFVPFERRYGLKGLSRDWNSYAIRNDENIIAEIFARHGLPEHEHAGVVADYLELLRRQLADGTIQTVVIQGALELLQNLRGSVRIGIATANLLGAAELRLKCAGLWDHVSALAHGADGGGHKREFWPGLYPLRDCPGTASSISATTSMTLRRVFPMMFISLVSAPIPAV